MTVAISINELNSCIFWVNWTAAFDLEIAFFVFAKQPNMKTKTSTECFLLNSFFLIEIERWEKGNFNFEHGLIGLLLIWHDHLQ